MHWSKVATMSAVAELEGVSLARPAVDSTGTATSTSGKASAGVNLTGGILVALGLKTPSSQSLQGIPLEASLYEKLSQLAFFSS